MIRRYLKNVREEQVANLTSLLVMARLFRKGKKKPTLSEDFERSIEQMEHILESNPSLAVLRALLEQYAVGGS